jgi:hypothetical protein
MATSQSIDIEQKNAAQLPEKPAQLTQEQLAFADLLGRLLAKRRREEQDQATQAGVFPAHRG